MLAIVIPAYNCETTIKDTLDSLQQIQSGWEAVERVVVCDDASSDNTLSVLRAIHFTRCPITVVRHRNNQGEAACYKTIIDSLPDQIDWFLILHSDDIALECFLKRNLEIVRRCNDKVASVSSNYYVLGPREESLAHSPAEDRIIFRGDSRRDLHHTAVVGCWWHISGSLINRKLWQRFGGRDPKLPQVGDWDLILRWQSAGFLVGHSLIPTTKYRIHQMGSVSSRSYVGFKDLRERAQVALKHPTIFPCTIKRAIALQVGLAAGRRVCKLLASAKLKMAIRGVGVGWKCVISLIHEPEQWREPSSDGL